MITAFTEPEKEELDRVYSADSLEQFLASRPETGAH